jgi:hypothetical protein
MKYQIRIDLGEYYKPIHWCYNNIYPTIAEENWQYYLDALPSHHGTVLFAQEHDFKTFLLLFA